MSMSTAEFNGDDYVREGKSRPLLDEYENEFNLKCEVRNRGVLTNDLLAPKPQSNARIERSDSKVIIIITSHI